MSNIEAITITVSSIAIAVAVISAILFWWYGNMQRWYQHLARTPKNNPRQSDETAGVIDLLASSLKEELSPQNREVLETIVRMNSQRRLTSLFEDPAERFYLFEALSNPSRFPWEEGQESQKGETSQKKVSKQVRS
jgi:hypothetical protein